jgi:aspartate aminotransferase
MKMAGRVRDIDVSGIRKLFESAGPDSVNLGLGQPDFDTPIHIREAAIRAIREGKTGYTNNTGIIELRTAITDKLKHENGLTYSPDQVIVTAGASEALHILMQATVEEGDRVLLADPGFVSYAALATIAGGRPEGRCPPFYPQLSGKPDGNGRRPGDNPITRRICNGCRRHGRF